MKSERLQKWLYCLALAAGIALLLFVHWYKLTQIPWGLHADEAGAAYDAFSILNYGVDRSLNSYPVYFTNYGDGQNALYIYIMVFLFKIFGISRLTIRAGMAAAACAAAVFVFLYARERFQSWNMGLAALYLYAVMPVFIMMQRFGLESHLMLAAAGVCIYFSAMALKTGKWYFWLLTGLALGITLYTYALSYIVIPLFLIFMFFYSLRLRAVKPVNAAVLLLPLAVLAAPLILVQIVNLLDLPSFQIGPFTITHLYKYRTDELSLSFRGVYDNLRELTCSTVFYDELEYNTQQGYGTLYYVSIPFLLLGLGREAKEIFRSVRDRRFHFGTPAVAWFLGECLMACLLTGISNPNTTRMNGIFLPYLFFVLTGLKTVWDVFRKSWKKYAFGAAVGAVYAAGFLSFISYYFTEYTEKNFPMYLFYVPYEGMRELREKYADQAWMQNTTRYPWNYVYYMLEFQVNPWEFNLPANGKPRWGTVQSIAFLYELDGKLRLNQNYVVPHTDKGLMNEFRLWGCREIEVGDFSLFVSAMEWKKGEQVQGFLDYAEADREKKEVLLSGWGIDEATDRPFDSIYVKAGDEIFEAEAADREDVAEYYEKPEYRQSGFLLNLPTDFVRAEENIKIYGTAADGQEKMICEFSVGTR